MKFHDAVRKHIKVLDGIQKKMRTKDEEIFFSFFEAVKEAKISKEESGGTWVILDIGKRGYLVDREENIRNPDERKQIVKKI